MKKIYKYELKDVGITTIDMPTESIPLHAYFKDKRLYLWCLVDTDNLVVPKSFATYQTGDDIEEESIKYIATAHDDWYVAHIFEILNF